MSFLTLVCLFVCLVKEELTLALLKTTTGENLFLDRVYATSPHFSVFLISFMTLWSKQLKQGTFVQDSRSLLSLSLFPSNQTICSCKKGDFDLQGKLLSGDQISSYPLISYGIWVNQSGSIFLPHSHTSVIISIYYTTLESLPCFSPFERILYFSPFGKHTY